MSLTSSITSNTNCTGLELRMQADGSYLGKVCAVSVRKNLLNIDQKVEVAGTLDTILKKIPRDRPLAVTLTGKGILTRKIAGGTGDEERLLNEAFPNIKTDQFYVQDFEGEEGVFVTVVRKDVADTVLAAFDREGLAVLTITAGPFVLSHILPQLNTYDNEICIDGHLIHYTKDWKWENYRFESGREAEFPFKIGIEPLAEGFLTSYATAFQFALRDRLQPVILRVPAVEETLGEFDQKQRFNLRLSVVLGSLFILLLVNFLLYSYYNSENERLLSKVSQTSASMDGIQQLEKQITVNERLLKELGWNKGIRMAWLADQIGQTIPSSLRLLELGINPLDQTESSRQRKDIYSPGTIRIKGEASDPAAVNNWIYALKELKWVKQVNLDSFSPSQNSDKQEFMITINY